MRRYKTTVEPQDYPLDVQYFKRDDYHGLNPVWHTLVTGPTALKIPPLHRSHGPVWYRITTSGGEVIEDSPFGHDCPHEIRFMDLFLAMWSIQETAPAAIKARMEAAFELVGIHGVEIVETKKP